MSVPQASRNVKVDRKKTALVIISMIKRSLIVVCFPFSILEDVPSFDERELDREAKLFSYFNPSCLDVIHDFYICLYLFFLTCCISLFDIVAVSVPDPIALYPLNSEYQTREANNRQPMGTIGTDVYLAPGPDGKPRGSYQFSGDSGSYIEFPNNGGLNVKNSITVLCWVYMETSDVSGRLFTYNNPTQWGIRLKINSGKLRTRFKGGTPLTTDLPLEPKQWHHVGSSYNHNTGKANLWLNGTKVEEEDIGAVILATEQTVRMGATFKGRITAMQIYNVALTAEQINEVKDAGRGRRKYMYDIRACVFTVLYGIFLRKWVDVQGLCYTPDKERSLRNNI